MASNESDEDDYMSDAFLTKCEDVRPGLVHSKKTSRQNEIEKKQKEKQKFIKETYKPKKVLEHEKREEGLNSAISSENKGFALLQKMGYKPGQAIGKQGQGRTEPVPVVLKLDGRGGLGKVADQKRRQEAVDKFRSHLQQKRQKMNEQLKTDFVNTMSSRKKAANIERDLYKSQKVCHHLDSDQNLESPKELYFWPKQVFQTNQDEEEETDEETDEENEEDTLESWEKLEVLTNYLRTQHIYCVWCGTRFEDSSDLAQNCPGSTSEDHDE
ncbi:unnamed protein product [Owenia fusiformis]|uniref:G patch domain-containing protein 11 n=1 Tax=Owenia fusiformis TaxID=6347 RepID=A0A8J1XVV7_OWEFU|nr:unnamed protein product [Owenia fusiformis]